MADQKLLSLDLPGLIQAMQPHIYGKGLQFAENAAYGGVSPAAHAKGGFHYFEGGRSAVDVRDWRPDNAPEYEGGPNVPWQRRAQGFRDRFRTIFGQNSSFAETFGPGDKGHDSHTHWGLKGKADLTPDSIAWLATGNPALRPKVQAARPSAGNSFRPAGAALAAAAGGGGAKAPSNADRWLGTIRYAEHGREGAVTYSTMFGGGRFDPAKGHPNRVVTSGGHSSAAAGAYQFMPDTWSRVSKQLGLKDFSPASQDRAARQLALARGVNIDTDPLTPQNLAKLAPEWASLPNAQGRSAYNQPVRGFKELEGVFKGIGSGGNVAGSATSGGATGGRATGGSATSGGATLGLERPESSSRRAASGEEGPDLASRLLTNPQGQASWADGSGRNALLSSLLDSSRQQPIKTSTALDSVSRLIADGTTPAANPFDGGGVAVDEKSPVDMIRVDPIEVSRRPVAAQVQSQRMAGRRLLRSMGLDGGAA
jgi:muramidase (phage lysozyme)